MKPFLSAVAAAASALALHSTAHASQPILQRGYDAGLSGANLTEVTLNTSNVAPSTFGQVFTLPVDDRVYAQPLYVPGLAIPNQGTHNVVYVATMSDTLFAFDADTGAQLWSVNFASSVGATSVPFAQFTFGGNTNIAGNLGILSTPVIDPATNIMYLVACTLEGGTMVYRLHAVNIATGTEPYANVVISGSYGGSTFDAPHQTQRVSLTLSGNQVIFGFGAVEEESADVGGYVGWVMAYNKTTLAQSGAFATITSGTKGGGVWQSGRPPVVDTLGCAYVFVGNGYTSGYDGVHNFNESALKLTTANGLTLVDWFTPDNWSAMDAADEDLSSSGPMLIPGTNSIAGGGKTGVLYVLNTANLGHYSATDSGVIQEETISASSFRGGPVYWQRSQANGGPLLYNWGSSDRVKAYAFGGTTFASTPSFQGSGTQIYPGGILALSANADTPGSGVLWATVATSGNVYNDPTDPGVLHAYDADNVATELWNSSMNSARDNFGSFAKFVPPLVANGRVYVATFSNQVAVYGLLSSYSLSSTSLAFGSQLTNLASAPKTITVTNTGAAVLPITSIYLSTSGSQPFSQINTCRSSLAAGASCMISVIFDPAAAGSATATLSVNVGNGVATQTVALSGTGVVPVFTASPTSVIFGTQMTNVASAPVAVTVTNTGVVPLPIAGIALSTSGSQPFSQTNTCGNSVAVGATCIINIVFDPASAGANTAALNVNVTGQPLAISLSGSGNFKVGLTESSQSVTAGVPVTLTWSSTSGATCTASGGSTADTWTGSVGAGGSRRVTETSAGTYKYGLDCVAQGVSATATVTTAVTVPKLTLSATPSSITVGKSVTLSWASSNATACVASGGQSNDGWAGTHSTNGTVTVTPVAAGTISYTLDCSSGPQSVQATAQVVANAPAATTPPVATVNPPSSSGGGGALDTISLLSLLTLLGLRHSRRVRVLGPRQP
jgi:PQQ-like domain